MTNSAGLSNGVIKRLAEDCGTSVAMIAKHYGKYTRGDVDEKFSRLLGTKTETLAETPRDGMVINGNQVVEKARDERWWAHLDSNPNGKKIFVTAWTAPALRFSLGGESRHKTALPLNTPCSPFQTTL